MQLPALLFCFFPLASFRAYFMRELTSLLTEWETEIQYLEAVIRQQQPRQQRQLRRRLHQAYQSKQLLTGLSQQLLIY
jgi:hypothetical protein